MEVRRFLKIARFGDMGGPQRLLRNALRPRFRMDSLLPSEYESEEQERNKADDRYVVLSSFIIQRLFLWSYGENRRNKNETSNRGPLCLRYIKYVSVMRQIRISTMTS